MRAWRPLLRRARRLAWRSPLRTISTGLLVAVPVFAVVLLVGRSCDVQAVSRNSGPVGGGDAAYLIAGPGDATVQPDQVDRVVDAQPEESTTAVVEEFQGFALDDASHPDANNVTVTQGPWRSRLTSGLVDMTAGRLPGRGEVVVTPWMAVNNEVDIGDRIRLQQPRTELTVVGIGKTDQWTNNALVVDEGEFVATGANVGLRPQPQLGGALVLVDLPPGAVAPAEALDLPGVGQVSSSTYAGRIQSAEFASGIMILLCGVFVALSAGAVFGIGAARRRRAMGLIAANGADTAMLRMAVAAEVLVVAGPAAVLGATLAMLTPRVWIHFRLRAWDALAGVEFPWPWVAALLIAAVAAAVLGGLAFSRSLRASSLPRLLDDRPARRRPRRLSGIPAGWIIGGAGLVGIAIMFTIWSNGIGAEDGFLRSPVWVGLIAGWCVLGVAVWLGARRLLRRDAVGRLAGRDLARRPLGAIAAGTVVALWVFAILIGAATQHYDRLTGRDQEVYSGPPYSFGGGTGGSALFQPGAPAVVRRGTEIIPNEVLPAGLQAELAEAGLPTVAAIYGRWTGGCALCPPGWVPSVLILDSLDGAGLPPDTVELLRRGYVVTGFDAVGEPGSNFIAGLPIAFGQVANLGVDAVVSRETVAGSPEATAQVLTLENPRSVLVGSTAALGDEQIDAVAEIALASGVGGVVQDPRFQEYVDLSAVPEWARVAEPYSPGWSASEHLPWLVVLIVVTLAATAVHRREHGEAARVLVVLGAPRRSARRLAAYTSGLIAGVSVVVGIVAAVAGIVAATEESTSFGPLDVLWSRAVVLSVGAVAVLPLLVVGIAWLLPPARSTAASGHPDPA